MEQKKLEKIVERIFDKMEALPKRYAQMTCSSAGTHVTFIVYDRMGKIAVPMNVMVKPFYLNFEFVCEFEDLIKKVEIKEHLKKMILEAEGKLKDAKNKNNVLTSGRIYRGRAK